MMLPQPFEGAIGRAVVHDNDGEVMLRLKTQRLEAILEKRPAVPGGYYDRDERHDA